MKLFKSCKPEHDVASECKSLKLGTLYGYQRDEDDNIRDEGEGTYHLELQFLEKIKLSKQIANVLLHPLFNFGAYKPIKFSGHIQCTGSGIRVENKEKHSIAIEAKSLAIRRQVSDRFVFCMSISRSKPPAISGNYTTHWGISDKDAAEFAHGMAKGLIASIKKNRMIVKGLSENDIKTLKVIYKHRRVSYISRTHKFSKVNQESVDSYVKSLTYMDFIKPSKYAQNYEYRFTFEVHSESGVHLPASDSAFIDSTFIEKHVIKKPRSR